MENMSNGTWWKIYLPRYSLQMSLEIWRDTAKVQPKRSRGQHRCLKYDEKLFLYFSKKQIEHGFFPFLVGNTESVAVIPEHTQIRTDDLLRGLNPQLLIWRNFVLSHFSDSCWIFKPKVYHFSTAGFYVSINLCHKGETVPDTVVLKTSKRHPDMVFLSGKTVSVSIEAFYKDPFKTQLPSQKNSPRILSHPERKAAEK